MVGKHTLQDEFDVNDIRLKTWPLVAALACSVVFMFLFSWIAEEVFEGEMLQFDSVVRMSIHEYATPSRTVLMQGLSNAASPGVLSALILVIVVACIVARLRRPAVWIVIAMTGAVLLDFTLKELFHRQRPDSFFGPLPHSYSFPSGHALGSFCFYGVVAGLCSARIESRFLRALIWVSAALLILGIGISRIYLGVHYPSDVLAGYSAAAVWVSALLFADRVQLRRVQGIHTWTRE